VAGERSVSAAICAPVRPPVAQRLDRATPAFAVGLCKPVRPGGAVGQAGRPFRLKTLDPFAHGFLAHPEGGRDRLAALPFDQHASDQIGSTV
jgi:hypothetical protein